MLPEPLHPAMVHFPLALAVLLPISALVALWTMRRGTRPLHAWSVPMALALLLTASAFVALRTGEAEEERVEHVVSEAVLHEHEEAAERFLLFSGLVTLVGMVGLARGTVGTAGRLVATLGSVVVLVAAIQVGAAGGELVYVHGAASAYVDGATVDADAAETAGAGTRVALPGLFTIMAGLERDVARISRGLWLGAADTVAAGADGIAGHARVPANEARAIADVLGPDMRGFAAMDGEVHDLSVQLRDLARAGVDPEALLPVEAELRRGCVGCHERFRDTLRAAIR